MKKIVLGLSALVATYFGVCVSQCDVNAQVSAQPIVKLVESGKKETQDACDL